VYLHVGYVLMQSTSRVEYNNSSIEFCGTGFRDPPYSRQTTTRLTRLDSTGLLLVQYNILYKYSPFENNPIRNRANCLLTTISTEKERWCSRMC
jgi:hypothetical protein